MTVMVTGASGPVGHVLIPRLLAKDEVRAVVRRPDAAEPLRAVGAKVAVGRLDDADALAEVFRRVYTVIHLVGGPNQPDEDALWDANHRSVLRALTAAKEAGVRRFVLVSVPGASPEASDPYLRARGLAEEAVTTSGLDHAVIRSTHLVGAGCLWFTAIVAGAAATPPVVIGDGHQVVAPLALEDLAEVLAAADDREGELAGTWALEGPDVVSADGLMARLVGGEASTFRHVESSDANAALDDLVGLHVSGDTVASFCASSRADAPDAGSAFGITPRPLDEAIQRTLDRVAEAAARDPG